MAERFEIRNRNSKRIVIILDRAKAPRGLTFVMHGLSGTKDQIHVKAYSEAFIKSGFDTVRFDVTHTFGESEGNYEDATTTNYYEDLVDVLEWSRSQPWYREPFCLAGHSLGAFCVALYAEEHPEKVMALAPISTVVSGKLYHENIPSERMEEFNRTGWRVTESKTIPGFMKRLRWKHFSTDIQKYDLLKKAEKLKMPVLLIVGENDDSTPLSHQKILFEKLPGRKEIHVIKGAPHTPIEKQQLVEIKKIFKAWISTL